MRILKDLIEKAEDTLEEIEWYAKKAHALKAEYRSLSECYIKIAEKHIDIYKSLHDQMVELINEEKRKGAQPPVEMVAIWNYEHEKLIKEFAEAKFLVEEYHK